MPQNSSLPTIFYILVGIFVVVPLFLKLIGIRIIGNTEVGVVEKMWSGRGSLEHDIIALNGEAGFQPDVIRGGFHLIPGYQYRVHKVALVTIQRGRIGYVFARDGKPLEPGQTLGRIVASGDFTDVRKFLEQGGQKGPQRAILREGTYAINLAQFVVVSGVDQIHYLPLGSKEEFQSIKLLADKIEKVGGFTPIIIDGSEDRIGIVTVHDGASLPQGDIIAPTVGDDKSDPNYHNNFQDPEAFIRAGGFRGRQYQVLAEGTYFVNRLFATIEFIAKTIVHVGEAGVVVSFYGEKGKDISGDQYGHGELCEKGGRGIWSEPLLPGKYAFNTYAGQVIAVPTINLILKWIRNEQSTHRLDEGLREINLITKDAFEPELPLSVVVSIDYRKAPYVIQRFGSVRQLIEQSLDPLVSAYFKNEGQNRTLFELIQERSAIQSQATIDMRERFAAYDLNLQEVLIGTPHSKDKDTQIESILNQLRDRQIATEQRETYARQREAQGALRELNEARATAEMQPSMTQAQLQISVQENEGKAAATRAIQEANKLVTMSEAEARKLQVMAEAEANRTRIAAEAEAARIEMTTTAQAKGTARTKIAEAVGVKQLQQAYGGTKMMVARDSIVAIADALKSGQIALVPKTQVVMGGGGNGANNGNALADILSLVGLNKLGILEEVGLDDEDNADEPAMAKEFREDALRSLADQEPNTAPNEPTKGGETK